MDPMTMEAEAVTTTDRGVCPDSPMGAHHWVIGMPGPKMAGVCKYCNAERAFQPFAEDVGFNNAKKHRMAS